MKLIRILSFAAVFFLALRLDGGQALASQRLPFSDRPAAPVQGFTLQVSAADATSIRLQWQPLNGASEYELMRDGSVVSRTVASVGYFTDFGLRPGKRYHYTVSAYDLTGTQIAQSAPASAKTTRSSTLRTHYTVLALAFNPDQADLTTEATYLKHRIQFLELASMGSVRSRMPLQATATLAPATSRLPPLAIVRTTAISITEHGSDILTRPPMIG